MIKSEKVQARNSQKGHPKSDTTHWLLIKFTPWLLCHHPLMITAHPAMKADSVMYFGLVEIWSWNHPGPCLAVWISSAEWYRGCPMLVTPHWPLWPPPIDPSVSQPQQSVNTSASTDSTGSNRMTASSTNRAKRTGKPLPTLPAMSRKHWPPFFASFWFWGSSLIEPNENSLKQ